MPSIGRSNDLIIIVFLTAALVSALYMLLPRNRAMVRAFRMPKKTLAFALASSACAAVAIHLLLIALNYVPSSILYPTESGGVFLMQTLLSVTVLHESLKKRQYVGIVLAAAGLVLTNI